VLFRSAPAGPGMSPVDMAALDELVAQSQNVPAPAEAVTQEFGGPGVPGATSGTLAL
jgi:hypothetical protein